MKKKKNKKATPHGLPLFLFLSFHLATAAAFAATIAAAIVVGPQRAHGIPADLGRGTLARALHLARKFPACLVGTVRVKARGPVGRVPEERGLV